MQGDGGGERGCSQERCKQAGPDGNQKECRKTLSGPLGVQTTKSRTASENGMVRGQREASGGMTPT